MARRLSEQSPGAQSTGVEDTRDVAPAAAGPSASAATAAVASGPAPPPVARSGSTAAPTAGSASRAGGAGASVRRRRDRWRRTKFWMLFAVTVKACMRYRVTGLAAEAAFFGVLSLPPLVFGLAGTLGYAVGIFGDQTVEGIKDQLIQFARGVLTEDSVQAIIVPTVNAVLDKGRADIVSIGFVLALWSGSRALNVFIDTVTIMYGMGGQRGIVKTRAISFSVYTIGLLIGVTMLPLVLAGPSLVGRALPDSLSWLGSLYWPVLIVGSLLLMITAFHWAVPVRLPWRYGIPGAAFTFVMWILGSVILRMVLSSTLGGSTSIYGPLAAPIVVLIWLYVVAFAVLIGAALNAATGQVWPVPARDRQPRRSTPVRT